MENLHGYFDIKIFLVSFLLSGLGVEIKNECNSADMAENQKELLIKNIAS